MDDSLTVGDLAAWRLCGWISGGIIDGIPETILDTYPLLNAHQNHISNLPKVAEWLEKKTLNNISWSFPEDNSVRGKN
ncbi:MAG: hypothetical protein Ct9H300mP28_26110 [Pseudomonadota bacterium]|nr:MAG: hypothetical protein Ct9H300mP28_26110 [Pseudomonadota bacterium]